MKPIHIMSSGAFGEEVAEQFSKRYQNTAVTALPEPMYLLPSDRFPSARLHIFASWKSSSYISKQLDQLFFKWREPWLPITMDHPYVRIGPLVIPGEGPCFHCFESRSLQHSPVPQYVRKMDDYYHRHPDAGPKGYLRSFAGWSAVFASTIIKSIDKDAPSSAGSIWQMNMLTRESFSSKTVGIHGCPRCGLKRPEENRSVAQLSESLQSLLGGRRGEALTK
ncbi:TOMM precursor leader peptide-binding protein [Bacillus atrophaeus]|uniref:TOMM precursor leader peptide-binding protein n=1 Tax=Bacillus atrophaeus TaxID=1452 RepID=UPI0022803D80|nr:TOMM precursor leader peptide-binding protein [Bacillus atrophaeus]MCY8857610.1 TOMM precursor leader peptide-binding protein [Bacillus atrophaeus]MED1016476.1 TOMM precursor leader peptide-binding protein [Bacillus atrophaeus]MED1028889.1 TOMM precursor leader peptide-binding protein [Bacillus atrophaeus]MED1118777.1 TOMM precursor leader peptide-binding protein [Bacillus atrophaeus]MED1131899.1 TOMM precursor leader peptide-binding protein [Bacillus atrophaeus]